MATGTKAMPLIRHLLLSPDIMSTSPLNCTGITVRRAPIAQPLRVMDICSSLGFTLVHVRQLLGSAVDRKYANHEFGAGGCKRNIGHTDKRQLAFPAAFLGTGGSPYS